MRSVPFYSSGKPRRLDSSRKNRSWVERLAITTLLTLAWAWILAAVVLVLHTATPRPTLQQSSLVALPETSISKPTTDLREKESQKAPPKQQRGQAQSSSLNPFESPLLIFTCQRAGYLQQTLDDVLAYLPVHNKNRNCTMGCPIVVSQDGNDKKVAGVVETYRTKFAQHQIPLVHWQHPHAPRVLRGKTRVNPYQALAEHYGWALGKIFAGEASSFSVVPQRVVILEEDLHIAPDFFDYFAKTAPLLEDRGQHLFAVSAFNDNGGHVMMGSKRILRSDFFPGLGWMMPRWLWETELASKWPEAYWDDWLREPGQRRGRQILRPEVSRTFHFGTQGGASSNQFGVLLTKVRLNNASVDWSKEDLSYLNNDKFDEAYRQMVKDATPAINVDLALNLVKTTNVRLEYAGLPAFQRLAKVLNLMDDEKAGIPRTAYKGIVETRPHEDKFILFLTPRQQL